MGESYFGAVGGLDGVVGEGPVFGVGDGASGLGFDVDVVDVKVFKWGGGVGADVEGSLGSGGFDVPDVDVVEVSQAFVRRGDGSGEGDVVRGWGL